MKKAKRTIILLSYYENAMDWLFEYLRSVNAKKIAYIIDAKKPRLEKEPDYFFDKEGFGKAGFEVDLIDLENTQNLEERFKNADAIYVKGGNTFYLLNAMMKSG